MVQSFKYSFIILKNTKGFLISMMIMPIILIVLVSLTLSYKDLAVVGYVGDQAPHVDGVQLKKLNEDEIDYFLGLMQGTLVVKCNKNGEISSYISTSENNPLIEKIEQVNNKSEHYKQKPQIRFSIGILLFKFFTAGGLLATILIKEKRNGILLRVRNSKTSVPLYVLGKALALFVAYEIANLLIAIFYKVANFDFGASNPIQLCLVFSIALVMSFSIFIYLASILKNEGYIWIVSTGIIFPLTAVP